SSCERLPLQHRLGDVIAVTGAVLVGVRWTHAIAAIIEQAPDQERGRAAQAMTPRHRLGRKLGLHRFKHRGIENGLVLAAVNLATVDHLADIETVLEQMGERSYPKPSPANGPAGREPPRLAANSPP